MYIYGSTVHRARRVCTNEREIDDNEGTYGLSAWTTLRRCSVRVMHATVYHVRIHSMVGIRTLFSEICFGLIVSGKAFPSHGTFCSLFWNLKSHRYTVSRLSPDCSRKYTHIYSHIYSHMYSHIYSHMYLHMTHTTRQRQLLLPFHTSYIIMHLMLSHLVPLCPQPPASLSYT